MWITYKEADRHCTRMNGSCLLKKNFSALKFIRDVEEGYIANVIQYRIMIIILRSVTLAKDTVSSTAKKVIKI